MEEMILHTEKGEVHYWYHDAGAEDTMVFLHGLTANHHLFDRQVEFFQKDYNCLVWDAPAHGASRPYIGFSYPDAAEVLYRILNRHKIEKPILIGQSMGGYVVQSFLGKHPGRVKAFVSIDSCPYGEKYYSKSDRRWLRQVEWMAKCYPFEKLKRSVVKQCALQERARENMAAMLADYTKKELCHLMGIGYAGFLKDNRDMTIPCPTLLLVGEKDTTGKVRDYNRAWVRETGFPIRWVRDAAHNANDDQPEMVNRYIQRFLETL